MRIVLVLLLLPLCALCQSPQGPGQTCNNGDFESGTLTSWDCYTGVFGNARQNPQPNPQNLNPLRFEITTGAGTDPYGGFPIVEPSGGLFSCKLGNNSVGAEAEVMEQVFSVTPASSVYRYKFAVVLQDPVHPVAMNPYFKADIFDMNGNPVPCSSVLVNGVQGAQYFSPFQVGNTSGIYLPWQTVDVDLSAYIGQDVRVSFETSDCATGGHFGYAYIEASCGVSNIVNDTMCNGQSVNLSAPLAASYLWSPGGETTQLITVSQAGQYTVASPAPFSCNNQVTTYNIFTYPTPDTSVTINGTQLHANLNNGTYQWMDCTTGNIIPGATAQNYAPQANGDYAVIVSDAHCTDTSACKHIIIAGIGTKNTGSSLSVFPNPAIGEVTLQSTNEGEYIVLNTLGQPVETIYLDAGNQYKATIRNLPGGIYYVADTYGRKQKVVIL